MTKWDRRGAHVRGRVGDKDKHGERIQRTGWRRRRKKRREECGMVEMLTCGGIQKVQRKPDVPEGSSWSWFGEAGVCSECSMVFMDSDLEVCGAWEKPEESNAKQRSSCSIMFRDFDVTGRFLPLKSVLVFQGYINKAQ